MKYLLWLGALLSALNVCGQDRHFVDLSAQLPANPLRAGRITEVFDARPDRTSIGRVRVGLNNETRSADIKDGLRPALLRLLQTPSAAPAPAVSFALRVHRLSIGETATATTEISSAEVVVDFLRLRPDGQYDLLWRAAEATESRGMEVTGKHPANIAAVLRACLQQFEAAGPTSLPTAAVLTAEQATAPLARLEPLTPYPLLTEATRRPGVYYSLEEFRRNAPGSEQKVVVLSKTPRTSGEWAGTDDVELYHVTPAGVRTPVRDVWGYSDGQDLYILYKRRFYLLRPTAEGFAFDARSGADAETVSTAAVLGGLAGAGIAAVATSGQRQEHRLNLMTGSVTPVPLKTTNTAFEDADAPEGQVIVFRRKGSAAVVDVYAGKTVVGGLTPETGSVTIPWTDRRNALRLCVRTGSGPETCLEVLPRPGETLYVEWVEAADSPGLKVVPAKEGAFETRRAELRAKQKKA